MSDVAAFEATYADFKLVRTRKAVQLVFEIPLERANEAMTALGGMPNPAAEVWCAIARLDLKRVKEGLHEVTDKQVSAHSNHEGPAVNSATPQPQARNPYAVKAGILSNELEFYQYIQREHGVSGRGTPPDEVCAQFIRAQCGVQSRADILPGTAAADWFDRLEADYLAWRAAP